MLESRMCFFFFSSRRRHTRFKCDWSSDVCSSDLTTPDTPKYWESIAVSEDVSRPPQLLEMYLAPSVVAAVCSATNRPLPVALVASTRSILHRGQIAQTMATAGDSARVQSSPAGAVAGH